MSVANLLSNHEKLHAAFAHSPFIQTNSMAMTKADETFLKTLNEVIVANMQKSGLLSGRYGRVCLI